MLGPAVTPTLKVDAMDVPATAPTGGTMQLLIAHHDAEARASLARVASAVQDDDLDVLETGRGDDALELLLGAEAPQLALLEWDLPGVDGPELCRLASQFHEAAPPYIVLLARDGHELAEGLEAGAADCVRTPVGSRELCARLEAGRRLAERLARRREAPAAPAAATLQAERSPFDDGGEPSALDFAGAFELQSVLVAE
jgi:DNA-binding response OmpR family regulator